eukprot:462783_1
MSFYLSLGTNLGHRAANLANAMKLLQKKNIFKINNSSFLYESEPTHLKDQNNFLNAVICGTSNYNTVELLNHLKSIEIEMGRQKTNEKHAARIIDIDILQSFETNISILIDNENVDHIYKPLNDLFAYTHCHFSTYTHSNRVNSDIKQILPLS